MPHSTHIPDLEKQVDTLIGGLKVELDRPQPNPAVLARVKAAVRHELNERWLDQYPSPQPSRKALHRVRLAVREELARSGPARRRTSLFSGGWAAAAMMALCVGLIQQIGYLQPVSVPDSNAAWAQAAQTHVELFVETVQLAMSTDDFSHSVLDELGEIRQSLTGLSDRSATQDVLDELDSAMWQILDDQDGDESRQTRRVG
ncbi:MAG TPA: hypothetical protein PL151_00835 [Phycisphaerae bacterium]|nr:hypothetical protein [Phycisphaerae bacterium]HOJ72596.1 hypothetical protein [Phycisphaerae bacterium]HOM49743.1 hypothetical protein [Phycisphaerae bacterium]HON64965.1 hypothetical protein [Phycisphaerae bacterium]HOQ84812.1 hypothetical protein [Phycisphaerae bacterium]